MNITGGSPKRFKFFNWLSALLLTLWVLIVSVVAQSIATGEGVSSGGADDTASWLIVPGNEPATVVSHGAPSGVVRTLAPGHGG